MQRLNGIGRAFTQCVQFSKCAIAALENHANSVIAFAALVSAFATSAIFFLTISYVNYSKAQWQTMQSTLKYQIRQTQARLAITNLSVSNFPQAPIVSFCIENDGHAMADYIDVDINRFSGRTTRDLSPYGPAPGPITGFTLLRLVLVWANGERIAIIESPSIKPSRRAKSSHLRILPLENHTRDSGFK
jgi:hypothetical protein